MYAATTVTLPGCPVGRRPQQLIATFRSPGVARMLLRPLLCYCVLYHSGPSYLLNLTLPPTISVQ